MWSVFEHCDPFLDAFIRWDISAAHARSGGARPIHFHSFWMIVESSFIMFLTRAFHESQRFLLEWEPQSFTQPR
jgi:hypothetical protein